MQNYSPKRHIPGDQTPKKLQKTNILSLAGYPDKPNAARETTAFSHSPFLPFFSKINRVTTNMIYHCKLNFNRIRINFAYQMISYFFDIL